jgi:membrane protease YdiL (CAAX protease family)
MNESKVDHFEFFGFRNLYGISSGWQITIITALYIAMIASGYLQIQKTGKMFGYNPGVTLLFVPIYEELLFRGIMLRFFERNYGAVKATIAVSLLFGLWHLKNIFWLDATQLAIQMVYTAILFSPLVCWLTIKTRSAWPAVMVHYLNNLAAGLKYLQ